MRIQKMVAAIMLLAAAMVALGTYVGWWNLNLPAGPLPLHHLLVVVGAGYVLAFVPVYSYVKRRVPQQRSGLLKAHVFGNLIAFLLISAHFAFQMARPSGFAPALGTGLSAYILVLVIVATGIMQRFGVQSGRVKTWCFVHAGLALSIYVVVGVHALQNFGILL
ncbi:MAG: hypothetical protein ACOC9B_00475 [Chloroflexota bacterium]